MKHNATYQTGTYLQKVTTRFALEQEVTALAVREDGTCFAVAGGGLYFLKDDAWNRIGNTEGYESLYCDGKKAVYAAKASTIYSVTEKTAKKIFTFPGKITAIGGTSALYVLCEQALWVYEGKEFKKVQDTEAPCFCLAEREGRICIANERSLHRLEGKRKSWRCIFPEHSTMPALTIRCIGFDETGVLWVGAKEGMYLYDYKQGWYSHKELPALPRESVYALAIGAKGSVLCGTNAGAVLIRDGFAKYLPATRYAFSPDVKAVALSEGNLYTGAEGGVILTEEVTMTLSEKAAYFFRETEKYFPRKQGFVTSIEGVKNGDIAAAAPSRITDNDGLWTHTYLAGLCFGYAVTGDEAMLAAARRSMNAMLVLTRAPEIPGFTARAVRYPDEADWGRGLETQDIGEEWHRSSDGSYEWLGETSSDEMTGHFMGFSLYYDLCANEAEKAEICTAILGIIDHILENDGYLVDADGKPTTWGCWNPDALNHDSMWMWEKGINSLQMLTFLKVAHHMSGNEKYKRLYEKYIRREHFLLNAAFHKREDGHMCHIDDNLGMCISLTLLRLEENPAIRNFLLMGLTTHWNYERVEGNPFYNFVYGAFTGAACDVDASVQALKDYPLDMLNYPMINSRRRGIEMDDEPVKWGSEPRLKTPFCWDERQLSRLGTNPFSIDGGRASHAEGGMSYLLIYWLGRYFGVIS